METAAVLIFVAASLILGWALVRWENRRQAKRQYREAMDRLTIEMEQFAARLGEAFTPAVERAAAALSALGQAIAKIPSLDEHIEPRPPILDREPGPFAFVRSAEQAQIDADHLAEDIANEHFDNTIWDRD